VIAFGAGGYPALDDLTVKFLKRHDSMGVKLFHGHFTCGFAGLQDDSPL
jgi:hypothetical protein